MIELTDFVNICRLCLKNHDDDSVNLFSKQKIANKTKKEPSQFLVAEIIESFCNIKVNEGDGLPECICNECWNIISSMQSLQTISVKSDRRLSKILNSHRPSAETDDVMEFEIKFIDTQSNEENESETNCSIGDSTSQEQKAEPNTANTKKTGNRKCVKRKVSCEVCGKLISFDIIKYHLNIHKDIRPYKCQMENCEKHFTSPHLAKQHFQSSHVRSITRPYKCDVCGDGFIQRSHLVLHRSYHFDPEIPCPICGQLYRNKRALQRHSLVHSGERKYPCSLCEKSFQTSFTLNTHMRIHNNEKPFSCSQCPKAFAYKCLLKGHIEKHHPNESGQ